MAVLKILAPIQTEKMVNKITPSSPTKGCHMGIVTDDAILMIITVGVKGGINASVVAIGPVGSARTGAIRNKGIIAGSIAGKVSDWASLLSLHVAPKAAIPEPTIRTNKIV